MKIGIFSDLHDRTDHLEPAMRQMRLLDCGHFFFLGDCTTPESFLRILELTGGLPLDAVPGNNDHELLLMHRMAANSPAARLHPEHAVITRYGMKFSLSHYPKYAMREAPTTMTLLARSLKIPRRRKNCSSSCGVAIR